MVYLCNSENTLGKSIIYYFISIKKQKNQNKTKAHPQVFSSQVFVINVYSLFYMN